MGEWYTSEAGYVVASSTCRHPYWLIQLIQSRNLRLRRAIYIRLNKCVYSGVPMQVGKAGHVTSLEEYRQCIKMERKKLYSTFKPRSFTRSEEQIIHVSRCLSKLKLHEFQSTPLSLFMLWIVYIFIWCLPTLRIIFFLWWCSWLESVLCFVFGELYIEGRTLRIDLSEWRDLCSFSVFITYSMLSAFPYVSLIFCARAACNVELSVFSRPWPWPILYFRRPTVCYINMRRSWRYWNCDLTVAYDADEFYR